MAGLGWIFLGFTFHIWLHIEWIRMVYFQQEICLYHFISRLSIDVSINRYIKYTIHRCFIYTIHTYIGDVSMDLYFSKKEISLKLHQLAPCEGVVRCGRRPAAAGRAPSAGWGGLALQRRRSGGAVGRFFGPKATETPGMWKWMVEKIT
jgi:hypothetical protein